MRSFVVEDRRALMKALLLEDTFDHFLLSEVAIRKGAFLSIDGHEPEGQIVNYGQLRGIVYRFIQGNETPSYMKFVLLSPEDLPGVESRSINIIFREETLIVTSGFSYREFIPDKTEEGNWDEQVRSFLTTMGIGFNMV